MGYTLGVRNGGGRRQSVPQCPPSRVEVEVLTLTVPRWPGKSRRAPTADELASAFGVGDLAQGHADRPMWRRRNPWMLLLILLSAVAVALLVRDRMDARSSRAHYHELELDLPLTIVTHAKGLPESGARILAVAREPWLRGAEHAREQIALYEADGPSDTPLQMFNRGLFISGADGATEVRFWLVRNIAERVPSPRELWSGGVQLAVMSRAGTLELLRLEAAEVPDVWDRTGDGARPFVATVRHQTVILPETSSQDE